MKIKISGKIIILVAVLAISLLGIGLFSITNLGKIDKGVNTMYNNKVVPLNQLKTISDAYAVGIVDASNKAYLGLISWSEAANHLEETQKIIEEYLGAYMETTHTPEEEILANEVIELQKNAKVLYEDILNVLRQGENAESHEVMKAIIANDLYKKTDPLISKINKLIELQLEVANEIHENSSLLYNRTKNLSYIILFSALFIGILLAVYIIIGIRNILRDLANEAAKIIDAAINGNFAVRADAEKINFEFRDIIVGFNKAVDAYIFPIGIASDYIEKIAQGNLPEKITKDYNGGIQILRNNLNLCIDSLNDLTVEMQDTTQKQIAGDFEFFANEDKFNGSYKKIIQEFNKGVKVPVDVILIILDLMIEYSEGDLSKKMPVLPGKQIVATERINLLRQNILNLIADTNMLEQSATRGDFETRADASRHQGDYQKIVEGINNTLDIVVDKVFWYEQLLDAIPYPISVTDIDMNWTFINKAIENDFGKTKKDILGKACNELNTQLCNTENCSILQVQKGNRTVYMQRLGTENEFRVDTEKVFDKNGKHIGYIELIQDITKASKIAKYNKTEVDRLSVNLKKLAEGNTNCDLDIAHADKYTEAEYNNFLLINNDFKTLINSLIQITEISQKVSIGDLNVQLSKRSENDHLVASINEMIDSYHLIKDISQKIADGDLTVEVKMRSAEDEIFKAFSDMVKKLNEVVGATTNVAEGLTSAGKDINSNSQSLSQGSSEQAASIEEISSSMEEMVSNIDQNTINAQETEKIAVVSAEGILESSENVNKTVEAMEVIADKVSIINDIAFQTNILALNAAIEAARAGEHGRGFAVVAAEVRNLAEKTQVAAGEINDLTQTSVETAQNSGKLLSSIVPDIQKNAKLVQEIAAASKEQSRGAEQINKSITQLNTVAQQNASAAEEMSTAAEELNSQSMQLLDVVSFFVVLEMQGQKEVLKRTHEKQKEVNKVEEITKNITGVEYNLDKDIDDDDEYEKY